MDKETIKPYTESIVFAAEYLARACREYARNIVKENNFAITYEEYLILDTIFANPGLIQMDIAKKIFMQRSYVCKLVSKLEQDAFLRREKMIKGKRQVVMTVYLTEKGKQIYFDVREAFSSTIPKQRVINQEKMEIVTTELFTMANNLVETFNLKL